MIYETNPIPYKSREKYKAIAYQLIHTSKPYNEQILGWELMIEAHYWRSLQSAMNEAKSHTYFEQYAAHYLLHLEEYELCEATLTLFKKYNKWFGSDNIVRVKDTYWL